MSGFDIEQSARISGYAHPNRPLYALGREPTHIAPPEELPSTDTEVVNLDPGIHGESSVLAPEVVSYAQEEGEFSLRALKKYANPVNAAKAYGRFLKRTISRFTLPEVNGTLTALSTAYLAHRFGGSDWVTAWAGSLGEDAGFYGTTATQRYRELRKTEEDPYSRTEAASETVRYMLGSFALAEAIDKPVRPSLMWAAQKVAKQSPIGISTTLAVGAGKLAADHVYYGIVDPMVGAYYRRAERRKMQRMDQ